LEYPGAGFCRGGSAVIYSDDLPGISQVDYQTSPKTPQTIHAWPDDRVDEGSAYCGIYGVAAALEHLQPGLGRDGMMSNHQTLLGHCVLSFSHNPTSQAFAN
jgi:hypothetical protein